MMLLDVILHIKGCFNYIEYVMGLPYSLESTKTQMGQSFDHVSSNNDVNFVFRPKMD